MPGIDSKAEGQGTSPENEERRRTIKGRNVWRTMRS